MKINIEIECSPEEAREFFGMPKIKEMQEEMTSKLFENIQEGLQTQSPQDLFQEWLKNANFNPFANANAFKDFVETLNKKTSSKL